MTLALLLATGAGWGAGSWIAISPSVARAAYSQAEMRAQETASEARIREIRDQEVTQLRIALGRRIPTNRRADLYHRLAELYLEAYRQEFLLEGRVHEAKLKAGTASKTIDRASSKEYLRKGVAACNDVVRLGIAYPKLDRIYYFMGVNYSELGDHAQALRWYEGLAARFPQSEFVGEAYRELGDYEFAQNNFRKAQGYYELALSREQGEHQARTLHKLAWAHYRTRQTDKAVATMKEAIRRASLSGEKMLSLREEGLRDMAVFMTESGRVEDALAYFNQVAGNRTFYPKLLEALGAQYERNVLVDRAAVVYDALLKTSPDPETALRVQTKLIELDLRRGQIDSAYARSQVVPVIKGGDSDTQISSQNLRALIRRTATDRHEEYRKNGSRVDLATAEKFYAVYLNRFLASADPKKEAPEIKMYLADVKRELGKSQEASALYKQVVESGDKKYAKEAGALWTASLAESMRENESAPAAQSPSQEGGPSVVEQEFIQAADAMQKTLGDTTEGREAALKAAQVLAGYKGSQDAALSRADKLIDRSPNSQQALTAARLKLQIESDRLSDQPTDKASLAGLADAVEEVKGNAALMAYDKEAGGGKLAELVATKEKQLKVGTIVQAEKAQDYAAAAKGYEDFARTAPNREAGEKAYASALAAYSKSGDFEGADRVVGLWLAKYPGNSQAMESIRGLATHALIQGRFTEAGVLFERLGRQSGGSESMLTASRIFQGSGEIGRARLLLADYIKLHPKNSDRFSVALRLAQLQELDKQDELAIKTYQSCLEGPSETEAECGARLGDLYLRFKDQAKARAVFARIAGHKGKTLSPYVAYCRYRIAELMEQEANFAPLALPESKLRKQLDGRLAFLERLTKAYQSAVEAGGPWGVAALDRLAQFALNFANDVEDIKAPDKTDAAKFQLTISGIADPLRRKAVDTWLSAYRNAMSGEILAPALSSIADRLSDARLMGDQAPAGLPHRAQGFRGKFRLSGVPADGGAEGRAAALERIRARLIANAKDAPAWSDYGNLLWGEQKPLLSRLAYDRALDLDKKYVPALNNRAVVTMSGTSQEDWARAAEAMSMLRDALALDRNFLAAQMNRAALLSYYRLFSQSKALWVSTLARLPSADAHDGLAIAHQGLGEISSSVAQFSQAESLGADSKRFARVYHEAARVALEGATGAGKCYKMLSGLDDSQLGGFERASVNDLRRTCRSWKID